ncbi:MAG: phenylalanine--tRNA ligase subunit beta [Candidatus Bathyarchaeota archaeon]|nr:MAG: phenylalanine--tRNA ligase subunit beta [Candidatus Bathyarchaeota archaeon]
MPVITLDRERFSEFVGRDLSLAEMTKWLPWLGFDIEETGVDFVKVEFNPNRIDFSSYVGVARAFKGLRGWEIGLPSYNVKANKVLLRIEEAVSEVRPFMLAAIVRGIKFDEEGVSELMEMQEDLHWGLGRDRKKASIGVHNLDVIKPPFTFTAVEPHSVRFIPLDKNNEMSLKEILEKHEKGIAYKHLIDWAPKYPLLIDKDGKVLSMPPIINSELTRVDKNTRNLFLDVTGTDYVAVEKSLNVLSTTFAEMADTIESVKIRYVDQTVFSPNLTPQKMKLRKAYTNRLLGLRLSLPKIIECLRRCRIGARKVSKESIEAEIPPYRIDILHEVDLVEEVAIGYGYYKLKPTFPSSVTIGKQHVANKTANMARQIMIGLGFTEVMNFTLTNERLHYRNMRRKIKGTIKLANPVSIGYTVMRQDILPNLMANLADNKHESFPQRLFEVSDVVGLNRKLETQCERRLHVAAVSSHVNANFTEIKSAVEAFMTNIGLKRYRVKPAENSSFIEGRVAAINVKNIPIGIVGEIHPEVMNNFGLENPTAAFEINLEAILQ